MGLMGSGSEDDDGWEQLKRRGLLRGEKWVQFFSQRDQDDAENFEKFEVTGSDWV